MVTEREIPARQWTRTPSCRSRAPSNGNQINIKRMINLSSEHPHDLVLNGILIHKRKEEKENELTRKEKKEKKLVAMTTAAEQEAESCRSFRIRLCIDDIHVNMANLSIFSPKFDSHNFYSPQENQ